MDELLRRRDMMQGGGPVFVDWIQNEIGAYILFPYIWNNTDRISIELIAPTSQGDFFLFGSRTASHSSDEFSLVYYQNTDNFNVAGRVLVLPRRIDRAQVVFGQNNVFNNRYYLVEKISGEWGEAVYLPSEYYSSANHNIAIFGCVQSQSVIPSAVTWKCGKIQFLRYGESSAYIILQPCIYRGKYGLWDTISNTFFGNSGSGTITGGND